MMLQILENQICVRVFKDDKAATGYAEYRHGTLETLSDWVRVQNAEGMGVFMSVNGTDGVGCSAQNITSIRAWYADIDGLKSEIEKNETIYQLLSSEAPPSAIVKTKNGCHGYWYAVPGQNVDEVGYARTNSGIIAHFGGDASVKDIARVLRLPDTLHKKDPRNPYEIETVWEDRSVLYFESDLRETYPPPKPKRVYRPEHNAVVEMPEIWQIIVDDLSSWRPIPSQRHMAMLLAAGVAIKFAVPEHVCYASLEPVVMGWSLERDAISELKRAVRWAYDKNEPVTVAALRNHGVQIRKLPKPQEAV